MPTPLAIYLELLHRLVCVGPGWNLEYVFYYDAAYSMYVKHFLCKHNNPWQEYFAQNKHVHVQECKTNIRIVIWNFVLFYASP